MNAPRVRFAPSPTGSLHLGNARTALFNWLTARATGGVCILRIEDTDSEREEAGSEAGILKDLEWLGLTWDEGPAVGGAFGPYRQSERASRYTAATDALLLSGAAFRCFCSEDSGRDTPHQGATGPAGHRDPCRAIESTVAAGRASAEEPFAVRFRVPAGTSVAFHDRLHGDVTVPLAQIGDAVLARRDGRPTYNFAVVVDDAAMRIGLVLRGDDHLSNTPLQVLLYRALGSPTPEFAHVPMVLGPDGERLSKRHGATSVAAWRDRGVPPEALVNALALMGWAPSGDRTIVSLVEMAAEFDLDRVGRSAAIFDPAKLEWISAQYIHAWPADRLAGEVERELVRAGSIDRDAATASRAWIGAVAEFLRPALARLDQVAAAAQPLFHPGGALGDEERAILSEAGAQGTLAALAAAVADEAAGWSEIKSRVQAASGAKGKSLFQPIRIAFTGRAHGRELDGVVPLVVEGHRRLPDRVPSLTQRVSRTLSEAP